MNRTIRDYDIDSASSNSKKPSRQESLSFKGLIGVTCIFAVAVIIYYVFNANLVILRDGLPTIDEEELFNTSLYDSEINWQFANDWRSVAGVDVSGLFSFTGPLKRLDPPLCDKYNIIHAQNEHFLL